MDLIDQSRLKKVCISIFVLYTVIAGLFYFIGGDTLKINYIEQTTVTADSVLGEMPNESEFKQEFISLGDNIEKITIYPFDYNRENQGTVTFYLKDEETKNNLYEKTIEANTLKTEPFSILFDDKINVEKGKKLSFVITTQGANPGFGISFWGNTTTVKNGTGLYINGTLTEGELGFDILQSKSLFFGEHYFKIVFVIGILLAIYLFKVCNRNKKGKGGIIITMISAFTKYKFLMKQLVDRDFKGKYKRSVLGIFWSFLNPLLTMSVQYIVFSTLFKSGIENFPVYLLIGIILFNFFQESVNMGLASIVGNASLITKVYVPKYIYPITRVLSSAINLFISLIPLLFVILITKTKITISFLLIPFPLICLIIFCIGMSLILSSIMVFFRDTQFLWGVVSMIWMYATPLFYPENIIPERFSFILKINPLYHYVRFMRILILNGVSPEIKAYLFCAVFSVIALVIGLIIFKKTQDKFAIYI